MSGESSGTYQSPISSRVNFEIGEEGAPAAKRVAVDDRLCNRSATNDGRSSTGIGISEIESNASAVDLESNTLTVGAGVRQTVKPGFCCSFPGIAGGIGAE